VSTYVYKRAFEWNTFDLGYPSAIAVLWFIIILLFVAIMSRLLRQREQARVSDHAHAVVDTIGDGAGASRAACPCSSRSTQW